MDFSSSVVVPEAVRLNAICPYFTMFPLDFPLGILRSHATPRSRVLDPFCGRGTTNFAARLLGLETLGIDSSRVAVAATRAKLVGPTPEEIIESAGSIMSHGGEDVDVPDGEFWRLAYHPDVLHALCQLRSVLLSDSLSDSVSFALRGIVLGALHGPTRKTRRTYFSNQSPRTFGPKPRYSVKFWTARDLRPPRVDVADIISCRAYRYYAIPLPVVDSLAVQADSRHSTAVDRFCSSVGKFDWVITSPPYYGLKTYLPDQWIRNWFLGGPSSVDYSSTGQLCHGGQAEFTAELARVWRNVGAHCAPNANLVVRFGSIRDRLVADPASLVASSFEGTGWVKKEVRPAGNAARGKRQADTFRKIRTMPCEEVDVWAKWEP